MTLFEKIIFISILPYCLGSISGAILISKFSNILDPRYYGSKNPGATNIFRIAGYKLAIFVALFDSIKGAIPIWIGLYFQVSTIELNIIAISTCIGHMYPIFFQLNGGKGVATTFGILSAMYINFSILMISIWTLVIIIFRYVSLGSIITAIIIPIYAWYIKYQYLSLVTSLSILILIRHIHNIKRLWLHQEQHIW